MITKECRFSNEMPFHNSHLSSCVVDEFWVSISPGSLTSPHKFLLFIGAQCKQYISLKVILLQSLRFQGNALDSTANVPDQGKTRAMASEPVC
ncbi:hypothetical protein NPIL_548601 [Nephila pilipes]|uniref:Uncharacterized protein n=1 Tax=Nephila pilipes TaxID=299642 RepID=A0A8X6P7G5_NEPPI|nr:hypothetical protein NPIL_548601 [Nephila pilipes]